VLRELITEVDERDNMVVDKREGDYIYWTLHMSHWFLKPHQFHEMLNQLTISLSKQKDSHFDWIFAMVVVGGFTIKYWSGSKSPFSTTKGSKGIKWRRNNWYLYAHTK
jgi:hypothetical protein